MPPDPNQLRAQAQTATAEANASKGAAQGLRTEGDFVAHRVDFVMKEIRNDAWTGGAARTCRHQADDQAGRLRRIRDHLYGWADVADRTAKDLTDEATRNQQNAAAVDKHQQDCQTAQAAQPPQPCPLTP